MLGSRIWPQAKITRLDFAIIGIPLHNASDPCEDLDHVGDYKIPP